MKLLPRPGFPQNRNGTMIAGLQLPSMSRLYERKLHRHLARFGRVLPAWASRWVDWLLRPQLRWVRIPLGVVLILGGLVGFLPILGFWMIPLGLIVMALDLPVMQPTVVRCLDWLERKWAAGSSK